VDWMSWMAVGLQGTVFADLVQTGSTSTSLGTGLDGAGAVGTGSMGMWLLGAASTGTGSVVTSPGSGSIIVGTAGV
jgi:hypothetical protein